MPKDLKDKAITKETYEKELLICKKQSQKHNGHCCWGNCDTCGVFPLLYKLHKGKLLEERNEIEEKRLKEYTNLK